MRCFQRWRDTGSARGKLKEGSTSPLKEHMEWLLALVAEQPDLTLDEIVAAAQATNSRQSHRDLAIFRAT